MFYEMFVDMVSKCGWSQNYISKKFNINRGLLQKYKNGEALMPLEKFHQILREMSLSVSEKDTLCEQYYKELYGAERFAKIKHIEGALTELDNIVSASVEPPDSIELSVSDNEPLYLHSEQEITNAVNGIFSLLDGGEVITNYPYSFKSFDDALFRNFVSRSEFTVCHAVTFDKEDSYFYNLDNIFCSIRWLSYQVNPMCRFGYADAAKEIPYPCYFAAGSYCLLFHPDTKTGMVIKSEEIYRQIKYAYSVFEKGAFSLAYMPKDIFDFKNAVSHVVTDRIYYVLSSYPCITPIADEEFIKSAIKEDIPQREFIVQLGIEHYGSELKVRLADFTVSAIGLRLFADTGRIKEVAKIIVHEIPIKQRIRYFNRLIELVEKERVLILDDATVLLPQCIQLDFFTDVVQVGGYFENMPDELKYHGQYIINVNDKALKNEFFDFIEYLRISKNTYSKVAAVSFLKSLIILCEQMEQSNQ